MTTVSRTDPNLSYVHVITPPSGSTLSLRDNGYQVPKVTNPRTGAVVRHSRRSGTLTLSSPSTWDSYDMVFKVETSGRT